MSGNSKKEQKQSKVKLEQLSKYTFEVTVDNPSSWKTIIDEAPPLGEGKGPEASKILAASVGYCLTASLLFCLQKSRIEIPEGTTTEVRTTVARNKKGRWRISEISVKINLPESVNREPKRLARCLDLFEDFCVVTASVRQGIPVSVEVSNSDGIK